MEKPVQRGGRAQARIHVRLLRFQFLHADKVRLLFFQPVKKPFFGRRTHAVEVCTNYTYHFHPTKKLFRAAPGGASIAPGYAHV